MEETKAKPTTQDVPVTAIHNPEYEDDVHWNPVKTIILVTVSGAHFDFVIVMTAD